MITDMNNILHPFYHPQQHQTYKVMNVNQNNNNMVLPQPLKLYKGNNTSNQSPQYQQNDLSVLNHHYYHLPTFNQANYKPCETITPIYNQSWKLGRTSNDLMLPNEVVVPSSSPSPPSQQYNYHNVESHGLSMNSTSAPLYNHHNPLFSNNSYSSPPPPPPLSASSSASTSNYNYQGNNSNHYNGLFYMNDNNHHYRRSSVNTSRSSSPSTSSYASSPYQESARSPSPAVVNKRYACQFCNKRFTRPSSLTTHIYSHTGEKPFKCPVNGCGRHFSVVSNLRRHAKVHGNICLKNSGSSSTAHSF